jgi:hypothetical protein
MIQREVFLEKYWDNESSRKARIDALDALNKFLDTVKGEPISINDTARSDNSLCDHAWIGYVLFYKVK